MTQPSNVGPLQIRDIADILNAVYTFFVEVWTVFQTKPYSFIILGVVFFLFYIFSGIRKRVKRIRERIAISIIVSVLITYALLLYL